MFTPPMLGPALRASDSRQVLGVSALVLKSPQVILMCRITDLEHRPGDEAEKNDGLYEGCEGPWMSF